MAFTEQNKSDAYLFFVLAFGAAPGKTYGAQIVDAYNAGMDTAAIVAEYVTKPDFLKLYPATQTPTEFATALVNNVASAKTTTAVKEKAVADIVKAMAGGMKVDGVITQIMGNLAKKDVADTEWGATVAQINNKIAVAKVLTEGAKALETTDAAVLQSALKGVTEDQATVEQAISGAGTLAAKLTALQAANKAAKDYVTELKLGTTDLASTKGAVQDKQQVASKTVVAYADAASITGVVAAGTSTLSADAAVKAATIASAQAKVNEAVVKATKTQTDLQAALSKVVDANGVSVLKVLNDQLKAADSLVVATDALTAAVSKVGAAATAASSTLTKEVYAYTATTATAVATITYTLDSGAPAIVAKYDSALKDFVFTSTATAAQKAAVSEVIALGKAEVAAFAAKETATKVDTDAKAAFTAFTATTAAADWPDDKGVTSGAGKGTPLTKTTTEAAVKTATDLVNNVVKAQKDLAEKLATVNDSTAIVNKIDSLQKDIDAAKKAFTDAGMEAPVEAKGALFASDKADIYLVAADSNGAYISGFAAADSIYVGKSYSLGADLAKGDDSKLEVFFKSNGTSTDVYVEQKAFGSSSAATDKDIVKITLTGVAADKIKLSADGFITLA